MAYYYSLYDVLEQGEAQDFLFIATERYKFCVLQWDSETSELITRFNFVSGFDAILGVFFFLAISHTYILHLTNV